MTLKNLCLSAPQLDAQNQRKGSFSVPRRKHVVVVRNTNIKNNDLLANKCIRRICKTTDKNEDTIKKLF